MIKTKNILLILALYIYLNNPLFTFFMGIGSVKLLYPLALVAIINNRKEFQYYHSIFKTEYNCFYYFLFYALVWSVIGFDFTVLRSTFTAMVEVLILPFLFIKYFSNMGIDRSGFIKSLLIVCSIGAIISTICLAFPGINSFVKNSVVILPEESLGVGSNFRNFGISEHLTYDYGIIQGALLAIGFYSIDKNKWFLFFIPFVILSALFNARTGVVVAAAGVLVVMLAQRNFKSIILLGIVGYLIVSNFDKLLIFVGVPEEAVLWGMSLFDEVELMNESHSLDNSTAGTLFNDMLIFPENSAQWVFGRGYDLYGKFYTLGYESDVGFINQLNYGGLLYFIPLMYFIFYCFNKQIKIKEFVFALIFLVVFVIANIKGRYLLGSGGFRLMMLIYIYITYEYYSREKMLSGRK